MMVRARSRVDSLGALVVANRALLRRIFSKIRIIFSFYQILGLIPNVYNVELPDSIRSVLDALSIFASVELDFGTPLSCIGLEGFVPVLVLYMIAPLVLLFIIWLIALFLAVRYHTEDGGAVALLVRRATLHALPAILLALWILFPTVTSVAFKAFECEDFKEGEVSYLRADYTIECYTSEHTPTIVLGVLALFLSPLCSTTNSGYY